MRALIFAIALITGPAAATESKYLCAKGEAVVFGCDIGRKQVSLCASKDLSATSGYLQYRFGRFGHLELVHPAAKVSPSGKFFLSHVGFPGGGATRIRFTVGKYDYILFQETVRTNFNADQPNDPRFKDGVIVRSNGRTRSTLMCRHESGILRLAFDVLEREEFDSSIEAPP